jgi:hypothetical protein
MGSSHLTGANSCGTTRLPPRSRSHQQIHRRNGRPRKISVDGQKGRAAQQRSSGRRHKLGDRSAAQAEGCTQAAQESDSRIAHYIEIARSIGIGTPIALTRSMPCCINTGYRLCGRGATVGSVRPNTNGTWTLMPICEICAREIAAVYGATTQEG